MKSKCAPTWRFGFKFNKSAWWVGVHHSPYNARWCINLLPCLTVWVCKPHGFEP